MNENLSKELFEVDFGYYEDYFHSLKPGMFHGVIDEENNSMTIVSNTTGNKMCGYDVDKDDKAHYYIFSLPAKEESVEIKPRVKVILNTKEEVQAVINGLKEIRENGGVIPEHWRTQEEGNNLLD